MKYISAPYSKTDDKDTRMSIVTAYSANCLKRNELIICPLTMGHNFTKYAQLPYDSDWWLKWCFALLILCDEMDVLCIDEWEVSYGVQAEIEFANQNNIKVNYIKL